MKMKLRATVEKEVDIDDVLRCLLNTTTDVYCWWDEYESILYNFEADEATLLQQNPLPVLKACIGLYADQICSYAEKDLEKEINTFNHGGRG